MAHIGIMGGTFNPIHKGHIKLAQAAYEQYHLDKVLFMPAGDPPHKKDAAIVSAKHRMNMVKLAIEGISYFEPSAIEIEREGYTYTFETLKELQGQNTEDELYFILGGDSLFQIEKWYKPHEIFNRCILLAANSDDVPKDEFLSKIEYSNSKYNADVRPIDTPMMHISSTEIRNALSDNELDTSDDVNTKLVDSKVVQYIIKHHLYEQTGNDEETNNE